MSTSINQSPKQLKEYWDVLRSDPEFWVKDARESQGELIERLDGPRDTGFSCPIIPRWKMRESELTVWGGESGAGKSLFLGQIAGWLLKEGKRVCIMSFEMPVVDTLMRMITQAYGGRPTKKQALDWFKSTAGRIFCFNATGIIDPAICYGCVAYSILELQCQHVIVDNLMMLTTGASSDSTMASQKEVVETLKDIAMKTRAHVHLAAHLRKGGREYKEPTKDDVAGTSNIANLADNVLILYRNKEKRAQLENQMMATPQWDNAEPDSFIRLVKNRHEGLDVKVKLWYDRRSLQLCRTPKRQPYELIAKDAIPSDFYTIDRQLIALQYYTAEVEQM